MGAFTMNVMAQDDQTRSITGTVAEVAQDNSYVILNNEKMVISEEVLEYMNIEAGDEVELIIKETEKGKTVVDFNYI